MLVDAIVVAKNLLDWITIEPDLAVRLRVPP
jgi:hypothetical protein